MLFGACHVAADGAPRPVWTFGPKREAMMASTLSEPLVGSGAVTPRARAFGALRAVLVAGIALAGLAFAAAYSFSAPSSPAISLSMLSEAQEAHWVPPKASQRCSWVNAEIMERDAGHPHISLQDHYGIIAADTNAFYRGTAHIFWQDFVNGGWGNYRLKDLGILTTLSDGSPIERTSTWTWITGDQHLSNFGAWRNRHREVVFSVNDFDEAAIYDFQIDVWRLAVSIYNHAISNGLGKAKAEAAVLTFTDTYVKTVCGYVGNEKSLLFELTPQYSQGRLGNFLRNVESSESSHRLLAQYTHVTGNGERAFIKNEETRLEAVSAAEEADVRRAISRRTYGATLLKVGWQVRQWDDDYFRVLDVAARLGSGIGSYGVKRYYVLLAGADELLGDTPSNDTRPNVGGVILDVKGVPPPAVSKVLTQDDADWYSTLFANDAHRAIIGQRRLTSYVDPFAGWTHIGRTHFVVRQRSPWKVELDLSMLQTYAEFAQYVSQIAVVTATSHTRGTVGLAPGQFKEVISAALGEQYARATWGVAVTRVASAYRQQVLLDFDCFRKLVDANYSHGERRA